jgi:hypothetical protein
MPTGRRVPSGGKLGRNTLNAYAAGLLDGEGCIRWNRTPSVEVTNKHYGVLMYMQDRWGGSVRLKDEDIFVWTLCGSNALSYLSCVAQYSIIKYPQIVALFAASAAKDKDERERHINSLKRLKHVYTH